MISRELGGTPEVVQNHAGTVAEWHHTTMTNRVAGPPHRLPIYSHADLYRRDRPAL
jgi:hypothetical protein